MNTPKLKYEPLTEHLRRISAERSEVQLTFKDIEEIIGAKLPPSSWTHREWWGNQKETSTRPQAHAWLSAGFEVDFVKTISPTGRASGRERFMSAAEKTGSGGGSALFVVRHP